LANAKNPLNSRVMLVRNYSRSEQHIVKRTTWFRQRSVPSASR